MRAKFFRFANYFIALKNGNMRTKILILVLAALFINGCAPEVQKVITQKDLNIKLVDSLATTETVFLFNNLKKISEQNVVFGHHETTAYGIGWAGEPNRSDIKDVANDYPGVYGWDFGSIFWPDNYDLKKFPVDKFVKDAYEREGINIFCWHASNPVTQKGFYDTTVAVKKIIPGGGYYLRYLGWLDRIADFVEQLKDSTGKPIPIIFRPFHEFDGSWFWWGKRHCTREEFIELWRTTVDYLKNKRKLRNILYAFSPDRNFYSEEDYLDRYPGDDYVDILGTDIYYDFTPDGDGLEWITKKLKIVSALAEKKNKIAAFTETGLEGIVNDKWYTDRLLKSFDDDSIKIAFVMVWRNANKTHHYAPYKGHPSAVDFVDFALTPKIIFEKQLKGLYSKPFTAADLEKIRNEKRDDFIKSIYFYRIPF